MLVSYKWLKELVDVDVTTAELAEKMSTTGIEVEGVKTPAEGSKTMLSIIRAMRMFMMYPNRALS